MITGDHRETALAVAGQLGLVGGASGAAAGDAPAAHGASTGAELAALDDAALRGVVRTRRVFARVSPEQKLRLVNALQAEGHVVAMTGDGVNDAPALKQADIGVAMGITGTAVSREAADVVLTDDNFATIAAAVAEGRRVYDNLVKALVFVLPTNLGEALIILVAVVAFPVVGGTPLMPMAPTQILWINLVATVTLALPLAFEAREPDVMRRPPRAADEPLLGGFVRWRTAAVALLMAAVALALFLWEYRPAAAGGADSRALREAQTLAVTAVVLMQMVYVVQCRSLTGSARDVGLWRNPWIYVGIAVLLVLQVAFVYLPVLQRAFGSAPMDGAAWLRAAAAALTVVPVVAAEKWWRRRAPRSADPPARRPRR
jgi:magnesium-transporting ATPase (P-type)